MLRTIRTLWRKVQNLLLSILIADHIEEMNILSYPRGTQLHRAIERDHETSGEAGHPTNEARRRHAV